MSLNIISDLKAAGIVFEDATDSNSILNALDDVANLDDDSWDKLSRETQLWCNVSNMLVADEDFREELLVHPEAFDMYAVPLDLEDLDVGDLVSITLGDSRMFTGEILSVKEQGAKSFLAIKDSETEKTLSFGKKDIKVINFITENQLVPKPLDEGVEDEVAEPIVLKSTLKKEKKPKPEPKPEPEPEPIGEPVVTYAKPPAPESPTKKKVKRSRTGVTWRAKELFVDNIDLTVEEAQAILLKEGLTISSGTLYLIHKTTKHILRILKEKKRLLP